MNRVTTTTKHLLPAGSTERQAQIAEIVRDQGKALVEELATQFGVAAQTIRKDVNAMCQKGLLRRIHGGVELAAVNAGHYELRRILNLSAKRQVGQAAARLIPDGSAVAVSIGVRKNGSFFAFLSLYCTCFLLSSRHSLFSPSRRSK